MNQTQKMLFSLQRFQLLSLFVSTTHVKSITPAYALAWSESLYPFLDESAPWHVPYEAAFEVREKQLEELHTFLCDRWDAKNPITFYDLEAHYGVHGSARPGEVWRRGTLVDACRYFWLHHIFDEAFWQNLLSNCPSEAHSVCTELKPDHVYFL